MEVSSCEIETKYRFKIKLDLKDIDKKYIVKDEKPCLSFRKDFVATFKNGSQFKGYIVVNDWNFKALHIIMTEKNFNTRELISKIDLQINGVKKRVNAKGDKVQFNKPFASYGSTIKLKDIEGKISTCNGIIELEFQPTSRVLRKQELKGLIYHDSFNTGGKDPDFTITCQDKPFHFNKINLCFVSDVFQKMIGNSDTLEARSGRVNIEDFSPETIEAFKRVMFENDVALDEEDLTVDLLKFANKYCISPLIKVVAHHLCNNLSFENIYDVIQAAYLIDNEELLLSSAKFINGNSGHFKHNDHWKRFNDQHPKCAVKLLNLMMFNNSN